MKLQKIDDDSRKAIQSLFIFDTNFDLNLYGDFNKTRQVCKILSTIDRRGNAINSFNGDSSVSAAANKFANGGGRMNGWDKWMIREEDVDRLKIALSKVEPVANTVPKIRKNKKVLSVVVVDEPPLIVVEQNSKKKKQHKKKRSNELSNEEIPPAKKAKTENDNGATEVEAKKAKIEEALNNIIGGWHPNVAVATKAEVVERPAKSGKKQLVVVNENCVLDRHCYDDCLELLEKCADNWERCKYNSRSQSEKLIYYYKEYNCEEYEELKILMEQFIYTDDDY